jgi:hypothetical protein
LSFYRQQSSLPMPLAVRVGKVLLSPLVAMVVLEEVQPEERL